MNKLKYLLLSLMIIIGIYTTFSLINKNKQTQVFQISLPLTQISMENINTQNIPIPLDIKEKMIAEQKAKIEEESKIQELKKQEEIKKQEQIKLAKAKEQQEKRKVAKVVNNTTSRGDVESRKDNSGYVKFTATAYCGCAKCCGKSTGKTASGTTATAGRTVAMSSSYSFGTKIEIQGIGTYIVEDRGGAIKGNRIDIFFSNHQKALDFGRKTVYLKVL
jgi:3D (Asp-Asp-Asp) domain-containing protein